MLENLRIKTKELQVVWEDSDTSNGESFAFDESMFRTEVHIMDHLYGMNFSRV